jgi:hypothetical protein
MIQSILLEKLEALPESLQNEVLDFIDFLSERYKKNQAVEALPKKRRSGILKGTFVLPLPDNFDDPLEEFAEYM